MKVALVALSMLMSGCATTIVKIGQEPLCEFSSMEKNVECTVNDQQTKQTDTESNGGTTE